jgi:hypothetical protein
MSRVSVYRSVNHFPDGPLEWPREALNAAQTGSNSAPTDSSTTAFGVTRCTPPWPSNSNLSSRLSTEHLIEYRPFLARVKYLCRPRETQCEAMGVASDDGYRDVALTYGALAFFT